MRPRLGWALGVGVLLPACGDSPVSAPGDTITVHGTVVDEYLRPQANVGVFVPGQPLVITDASGRFSFSDVRPPYDLVTGLATERAALVYSGLTRDDPLVTVPAFPYDLPIRTARGRGEILPLPGPPVAEPRRTSVLLESPEGRWQGSLEADSRYEVRPQWLGPGTSVGRLHALRWRLDAQSDLPVAYEGYGTAPLTFQGGSEFEGPSIDLVGPVDTATVSGSVALPTGFHLTSRSLRAGFSAASYDAPAWTEKPGSSMSKRWVGRLSSGR